LEAFQESLALSGYSTLSPAQQLAEAQRQYDAMLELAQGGDQSAIDSLPETARALLDASRAMFGSGARYGDVFARVNEDIAAILAALGVLPERPPGRAGGAEEIDGEPLPPPEGLPPVDVADYLVDLVDEAQAQVVVLQGGFAAVVEQLQFAVAALGNIERGMQDSGIRPLESQY
jgi:hypothetical protein